jgi:hypothetical protein
MIQIESVGRNKERLLYVKAKDHLTRNERGLIRRTYHCSSATFADAYRKPWQPCCEEFEKQARFALSGLQLLDDMMRELEE